MLPRNRAQILSPETYFSRGTRGTRTDVVTFYDPRKLSPTGEVQIAPKRASAMPMLAQSALTDDDRFLFIYNFTPAQSITVVDVQTKSSVGEIDGGGCALVYPTGPRSYFSLCGDGSVLTVQLNDAGAAADRSRTEPLFDPVKDPVTEKGVRVGDTWWFVDVLRRDGPDRDDGQGHECGAEVVTARRRREGGAVAAGWHAAPDASMLATQAAVQPHARRRRQHPQGSRDRGLGLRSRRRTSACSASSSRIPRRPSRSRAMPKPLLFAIFLGARQGRRLRPAGRKTAARRQGNRPDADDARHVLRKPC